MPGIQVGISCLTFGLASAPYVFTKVLKPFAAHLRRMEFRVILYLDDISLVTDSSNELQLFVDEGINLQESLGFIVNQEKSITSPTGKLEFFGVLVHTMVFSFRIPERFVAKLYV